MNDNSYILLILGIAFVSIGIWLWKRDREQFKILEDRLSEKEKHIYELYESLEQLMEDMDSLYRQFLPDEAMIESYQFDKEQEYDETNGDKIEDDKYKKESNEKHDKDIEIEENNIEDVIIKLKNEGVTEEDIAKRLGMGKGEVKLILELKNDRSR